MVCGALKKQSIQSYYAEAFIDHFSFDKIDNLMGDRMVLLLEALELKDLSRHQHGSQPWVMHYPCQVSQCEKTAWVLVQTSPTGDRYYGFGGAVARYISRLHTCWKETHFLPPRKGVHTGARSG